MHSKVFFFLAIFAGPVLCPPAQAAEVCTTQSQMQSADRDGLAAAATSLARRIQTNDQTGLRSATIPEYQRDFSGIADVVTATAPRLSGASPVVEQVYILDASTLQRAPGGAAPDAQFYCNLNKSTSGAEFSIPQLPPGRYAFAMVRMESPHPWRLSFLLRSERGNWQLAGLYPKALTAAGHDGLWYWQQARTLQTQNQPWNAWLYLQEAQTLLNPANFVSSTHLDKLQSELTQATPPALSSGIGPDTPLVLKAANGTEFRITGIGVDDTLGKEQLDIAAHVKVDALGDAAAARKRNLDAMSALVASHPELRKAFHGVWIFTEVANNSPYATEQAMADIP